MRTLICVSILVFLGCSGDENRKSVGQYASKPSGEDLALEEADPPELLVAGMIADQLFNIPLDGSDRTIYNEDQRRLLWETRWRGRRIRLHCIDIVAVTRESLTCRVSNSRGWAGCLNASMTFVKTLSEDQFLSLPIGGECRLAGKLMKHPTWDSSCIKIELEGVELIDAKPSP
jgi:hypothetical protein